MINRDELVLANVVLDGDGVELPLQSELAQVTVESVHFSSLGKQLGVAQDQLLPLAVKTVVRVLRTENRHLVLLVGVADEDLVGVSVVVVEVVVDGVKQVEIVIIVVVFQLKVFIKMVVKVGGFYINIDIRVYFIAFDDRLRVHRHVLAPKLAPTLSYLLRRVITQVK